VYGTQTALLVASVFHSLFCSYPPALTPINILAVRTGHTLHLPLFLCRWPPPSPIFRTHIARFSFRLSRIGISPAVDLIFLQDPPIALHHPIGFRLVFLNSSVSVRTIEVPHPQTCPNFHPCSRCLNISLPLWPPQPLP